MELLHKILDDVTAWELAERLKGQSGELVAADLAAVRVVTRLKTELLNVSVFNAVTSSIANKSQSDCGQVNIDSEITFFSPLHSAFFVNSTECIVPDSYDLDIGPKLQAYGGRLQLAQRLCQCLTDKNSTAEGACDVKLEILPDALRRVCLAAIELLEALDLFLKRTGHWTFNEREEQVVKLLTRAGAGEAPCIDDQGKISIPGWAERRRDKRVQPSCSAAAIIGNRRQEIVVLDASIRGLGISGVAEVGQHVEILLSDERRLSGSVEWARDGRFGIRLLRPLSPNDPLLKCS
jgi:hypothetical protein